jgi:hypothetical protein
MGKGYHLDTNVIIDYCEAMPAMSSAAKMNETKPDYISLIRLCSQVMPI